MSVPGIAAASGGPIGALPSGALIDNRHWARRWQASLSSFRQRHALSCGLDSASRTWEGRLILAIWPMGGRATSQSGVELATIDTVVGIHGARGLRRHRVGALLGVVVLACGVLLSAVPASEAFAASWTPGVNPSRPANAGLNSGAPL